MQRSEVAATPLSRDIDVLLGSIEAVAEKGKDCIPFSNDRIDFLDTVSRNLRSYEETRRYTDLASFAFWVRKSSIMEQKQSHMTDGLRLGRGLVFHIAPSNIPLIFAYSFAASFICGCRSLVRISTKEFPQEKLIIRAIKESFKSFPQFEGEICFVRYQRSREINDLFSSLCDVRIIWGGDESVAQIRKSPLLALATEICFADRYSLCVMDADALDKLQDLRLLAGDFYNDTYLSDQNACTSPRLICWLGEKDIVRRSKERFWKAVHEIVRDRYEYRDVFTVDKLSIALEAAAAIEGLKIISSDDSLVMRLRTKTLTPELMDYPGKCGLFYEYDMSDITQLEPFINNKVQTLCYAGDPSIIDPLLKLSPAGIDRIVPLGRSLDFDLIWDGKSLVEQLTRRISIS